MNEEWRPVAGFHGIYEVSDLGRVKSLRGYRRLEKIRVGVVNRSGYPSLMLSGGARKVNARVHCLVAAAFLGPRPDRHDIRHLDGDATNSRLDNLVYGTRSENLYDAVDHGTHAMSRRTHCPQGHEYLPPTTGVYNGRRNCLTCKNERRRLARAEAYLDKRTVGRAS